MQIIRLISIDLDGTLFTSREEPGPRSVQLLQQAMQQGIIVVPNTTRNPEHTSAVMTLLGSSGPMVCMNGSQVWATPAGPMWAARTIPRAAAFEIARLADQYGWELSTRFGPTTYLRQRPGQPLGRVSPNRIITASNAEAFTLESGDPFRFLVARPDAILPLHEFCTTRLAEYCRTEIYDNPDGSLQSLGIFPVDADKGTALRLVLNHLKIAPENVMAIGDNRNDLAMFAVAGVSVAMGNALPEIKARATLVAPSNDEEGVAWAVSRCIASA